MSPRRLQDHCCDIACSERSTNDGEIIGGAEDDRIHCFLHLAGLGADIIGWLYANLQPLMPAVEVAGEFYHSPASGKRSRQSQCHVCGLGTRRGEAHHFSAWHQTTDPLAPFYFLGMAGTIMCSTLHLLNYRLADMGWAMAEE